ncbi:MAG: nitrate/nitrite transporter NrtS [Chloroflexi bacterium]|nr:nitrate/nitrite transporter NrtS [Chloroflexota bacterium]
MILKCARCAIRHRPMVRRSLIVALVVGSILTLLNQGDILFSGSWNGALYWKVPLTYCVPLCVATYGALSNARR